MANIGCARNSLWLWLFFTCVAFKIPFNLPYFFFFFVIVFLFFLKIFSPSEQWCGSRRVTSSPQENERGGHFYRIFPPLKFQFSFWHFDPIKAQILLLNRPYSSAECVVNFNNFFRPQEQTLLVIWNWSYTVLCRFCFHISANKIPQPVWNFNISTYESSVAFLLNSFTKSWKRMRLPTEVTYALVALRSSIAFKWIYYCDNYTTRIAYCLCIVTVSDFIIKYKLSC